MIGIETEGFQSWSIGQAERLSVLFKLEVEHRHPLGGEQGSCLPERKAKAGPAIAQSIGKNLLQQSSRQMRKTAIAGVEGPIRRFRQSRLPLDIGNGVPQRGKALLVIGGLHGFTTM